MNIRKHVDYSELYRNIDVAMANNHNQMKLYCEIGRLVSGKQEKGAAVAAAEYLQQAYPACSGFSPRNLRRMRDFYRLYERRHDLLELAMDLSWTQNVVILEAGLELAACRWYLLATAKYQWTKAVLLQMIEEQAHLVMDNDDVSTTEKPLAESGYPNTLLVFMIDGLRSVFAPQRGYHTQKRKPTIRPGMIALFQPFFQLVFVQLGRKLYSTLLIGTLAIPHILQ